MSQKPQLRASNLDRLLSCHGSRTLEPLVPRRVSDEGDEGTAIHGQIAWNLIQDLGASGPVFEWDLKPVADGNAWIIGYCLREVAEELPADWSLEVESAFSYEFDRFILSGHIDALAISPDGTEAKGWDYKTGYDAADPAECNEQVAAYLALIKRAYPALRKATFFIVQPRNDEEVGQQRVSKVPVTFPTPDSQIGSDPLTASLEKRINAALADPYTLQTGRKQCRFCPAKKHCLATKQLRQKLKATITPEYLESIKGSVSDAELGDMIIDAKVLEPLFDEAQAEAKQRIAEKGFITAGAGQNISLKTTAGAYEVTEPEHFYRELVSLIPASRIPFCTKPTMAKIKDEIAEAQKVPKDSKKSAITATTLFDSKLRPFTEQGTRSVLTFS